MGEHTSAAMIDALPPPLRLLARVAAEQPEAMEIVRFDGAVIFANQAFVDEFGFSLAEIVGQTTQLIRSDRHPPAFFQEQEDRLRQGEVVRATTISRRKDGTLVQQAVTITPLKDPDGVVQWMIAHRRGLSQRVESREEATERLSALGTMAAGIAHEINNPLTWMLEHARGLASEHSDARAGELVEGLEMIRGTVSELLKLSQAEDEQRMPMPMSVLLDRAVVLEREALQHVRIRRQVASESLQVLASPRLVEALAYILRNAGQASAPGAGVQIAVRPAGGTVQLWIIDEGDGIDEADLPRVMEPLFTTRPLGEGLGLGLPTAESIIRSLGGSLVIASRHRRAGTVVTITLQSAGPQEPSLFGAEDSMAVLIVDDEPRVARSLGRLLRGHSVTTAASGREALQHLSGEFDLIICDLLMPIMTGMELFERFKAERPELAERFLFTTGGAWSDASRRFIAKHADRIVTKPFHRERLEQAIAFIRR